MSKRVLSTELAYQVKQLYQEKDERGRWKYTQMQIATMLGVGETTVFRAIKSQGAYRGLEEPKTEGQLEQDAMASLRKVQIDLGLPIAEAAKPVPARSAAERMAQAVAQKASLTNPDTMVEELTDGIPRNPLDE